MIPSSRMSLAGSRTQLAAPSTENLTTSGSSAHERKDGKESHIPAPTSTKRASFVEVLINFSLNNPSSLPSL